MEEGFEASSLESGTNTNSLGEASEQDVVRVAESMKKAQQMGAQIKDDQKKNAHLAQFLTYLISTVDKDEIRTMSVELFSRPDQTGLTMTLAIFEMLALFLPFYTSKVYESGINQAFPSMQFDIALGVENYMQYIKLVYGVYPFYAQIDKDTLSQLIVAILLFHKVIAVDEQHTQEHLTAQIRASLS